MQYEPKGLADILLLSLFGLGIDLGIEYGDEGICLSEKAMKRRATLEALLSDSRKQEETLPSDILKFFGALFLFSLDESGFIHFPNESTSKWEEVWQKFCLFTERLDDILAIRGKGGRPISQDAAAIYLMVSVSHELNKTHHNQKATQYWYYVWSLFLALKARLKKSEDFTKCKVAFERRKAMERELKAAKTAVDRRWKSVYQDEPPQLEKLDKESIEAWVVGDFSQLKQFSQRLMGKLDPH